MSWLVLIFLIPGDCSSPLICTPPPLVRHGVRNSLLLAPMPTASTAQILGNNESFEAYTSNIYTRRVLSGEFQVSTESICCCDMRPKRKPNFNFLSYRL